MKTQAARQRLNRRYLRHLTEDVRSRPESVDRDAGIVRGVKVIGLTSQNGRRYTEQALRKAVNFYEGVSVYADHPSKPTDQRNVDDKIGWLEGVYWRDDGLYANLHLLTTHDLTPRLLEAASKRPELFGLSHNADGQCHTDADGVLVVEEITEVRSVDLVCDPATNRSLFEGITIALVSVASVMEALTANIKLPKKIRRALLEMDDLPGEMAAPDDGMSPEDQLTAGFKAAMIAILDDDTLDARAKGKKIASYLKSHEGLLGKADEAPVVEGEPDGDEEESVEEACDSAGGGYNNDKEKKAMYARLHAEGDFDKGWKESKGKNGTRAGETVLTETDARRLCKLGNIPADTELLEQLVGVPQSKAISLLEWAQRRVQPQSATSKTGPRSSPAGSVNSLVESHGRAPSNNWLDN